MTHSFSESDAEPGPDGLLVQLQQLLRTARTAAEAIRNRLAVGDPAHAEIAQLEQSVGEIRRIGPEPAPIAIREEIAKLLATFAAVEREGNCWIEQVLQPELEKTLREQRVRDRYQRLPDPE